MPHRIFCALIVGCLSLSFAGTAAGQEDAKALPAESVEGQLREQLQSTVLKKLELHGSWADLVRLENGKFSVQLIVDRAPDIGKSQENALVKIVSRYLAREQYSVQVIRLPFRQLLTDLQDAMEMHHGLGGAIVEDAYYVSGPDDTLFVNLVGRVAVDDQRTEMINLCNDLIRRYFGPFTERVRLAKADPTEGKMVGVRLVLPAQATASHVYGLGIAAYTRRDYPLAYCYFTRARVDAPQQHPLQFWRIVSLIGMGQDEKASVLLTGMIEQSGTATWDPEILLSLERVQGPIRQRLVAMHNYLVTRCGTPPWDAGPVMLSNPHSAMHHPHLHHHPFPEHHQHAFPPARPCMTCR